MDEVDEELWERWKCEVDKGQTPVRIDKYLAEHMAGTSRNRIQNAADAGNVWVNHKPVASNYKVKPLDLIQVLLDHEPRDFTIQPEDIPLTIVYEDEDLLVINKPAGLVVHPGCGNYEHTLLNALAFYFGQRGGEVERQKGGKVIDINDPNIGLVHRIDKDTSGLLLIAKTPEAKTNLAMQFFDHTTFCHLFIEFIRNSLPPCLTKNTGQYFFLFIRIRCKKLLKLSLWQYYYLSKLFIF